MLRAYREPRVRQGQRVQQAPRVPLAPQEQRVQRACWVREVQQVQRVCRARRGQRVQQAPRDRLALQEQQVLRVRRGRLRIRNFYLHIPRLRLPERQEMFFFLILTVSLPGLRSRTRRAVAHTRLQNREHTLLRFMATLRPRRA